MSSFPPGVREGEFVKFVDWDVSGSDVGNFFGNLSGADKVTALKKATLRYGSTFFAFNSNGWCKAWQKLTPNMFSKSPGSTLYIRVIYPGWVFYPDTDSNGNDFGNVNFNAVPTIISQINGRKNPFEVVGFNTNGWIKSKMVFPFGPFPPNSSLIEGSYVREDLVQ